MSTWEPTSPGYCSIHGWHGMVTCPSCSTSVPTALPQPEVITRLDPAMPGGVYDRIAAALERIAASLEGQDGRL